MDQIRVDETTRIPFDKYLFKVIDGVNKSLLLTDISYSQLIENQNNIRKYFKNKFPKIRLSYNDNISLFAFSVIYDKHKDNVKSWSDVGDIFYSLVNDGFRFGINNDFALFPSERVCMCSNHSPSKYYCYSIDSTYNLITGSVCVNKEKIVDVNVVNKLKRDQKLHDKKKRELKKLHDLHNNIKHYNYEEQLKIIGMYKMFDDINKKTQHKIFRNYK
jgi:hypothetical protein